MKYDFYKTKKNFKIFKKKFSTKYWNSNNKIVVEKKSAININPKLDYINVYNSMFYFFIPNQDVDVFNKNGNGYDFRDIKYFKKIRFKPGYQVLFRFFRKKWSALYYLSNYRQKRLTKELYLFSCNNYINFQEYYLFNKKINVYKDPSKQLLNWKYIV